MKRKFYHPEPTKAELNGPAYWKSLDDLQGNHQFQEWVNREFPDGADTMSDVDRRNFMKIMAASFGLAGVGVTGCRMPERKILPYTKQPEFLIPGVANYYSTSMPFGGENIPLVVETHQARPTKIEGNPSYKPNGGGTSTFSQVSILDLYDPDRARSHRDSSGKAISRADAESLIKDAASEFEGSTGEGLAFLATSSSSPTRAHLVSSLAAKFPKAIWAEHEGIDLSNPSKAVSALLQRPVRTVHHFDKAKRILSLDSDFVGYEGNATGNARAYAKGRKINSAKEATKMSRLYVAESNLSLAGANADHRLRMASTNIPAFAALVASHLVPSVKAPSGFSELEQQWAKECAADLLGHKGRALVVAGSHLAQEVHQVVVAMNEALEARGKTLEYVATDENKSTSIADLAAALEGNKVKTLVILGGNPAYDAPASVNWESAQAKAGKVIRLGYSEDETYSARSNWHAFIAQTHFLESWGDGRAWDGTYVPVQPMLAPLFGGMTEIELLARFLSKSVTDPHDQVRKTFEEISKKSDSRTFNKWLAEGILPGSAHTAVTTAFNKTVLDAIPSRFSPKVNFLNKDNLEVRFVPSAHNWDGRFANNGWAQECPHPITKITWDNAILISAKLAEELGGIIPDPWSMSGQVFGQDLNQLVRRTNEFNRGREITPIYQVTVDGVTVEGPLHVQPGIADYTLVLPLGHGRKTVGRVGKDSGFNFYPVRKSATSTSVGGVKISDTNRSYKLANTQEHWSQEGRAIIREGTADEYSKNPEFTSQMGMESHSPKLYPKIKDKETGKWREMTQQEKAMFVPRGNSAYTPPKYTEIEKKSDRFKLLIPGRYSPDGLFDQDLDNDEVSQTYHQQWGMVIDFNACIGCNSCVVACQSENNIPIVGKDQVLRGREMHWMRIDRYFSSDVYRNDGKFANDPKPDKRVIPDEVQVSFQSVACAQCELAPCESVCPVNATVHDEQGLNTMAYNRCIGTRYCANNCPYKVRRFNFLDWNKRDMGHFYEGPLGPAGVNELEQMQKNPDVSVRMRGVMEKCTYCVQRIQEAKINHKAKHPGSADVKVPDGTIKTACQQSCPTEAITFGDILDTESEVSKLKDSDRNYAVLGYLNIRPRTTYLSKIRNPNPAMPKAYPKPFARMEYDARYGHGLDANEMDYLGLPKGGDDHVHPVGSGNH